MGKVEQRASFPPRQPAQRCDSGMKWSGADRWQADNTRPPPSPAPRTPPPPPPPPPPPLRCLCREGQARPAAAYTQGKCTQPPRVTSWYQAWWRCRDHLVNTIKGEPCFIAYTRYSWVLASSWLVASKVLQFFNLFQEGEQSSGRVLWSRRRETPLCGN